MRTRLSWAFSSPVGTVRLPLIWASLRIDDKSTPKMSALVDTGASYTLVASSFVTRVMGITEAELKALASTAGHTRWFDGLGGRVLGASVPISALVLWSGGDSLELPNPIVYCVPQVSESCQLLIGQRCALERLWLVHRNKKNVFAIGEASTFRP